MSDCLVRWCRTAAVRMLGLAAMLLLPLVAPSAALGQCPGSGSCFVSPGTPGCEDAACCTAVCAIDFFCCDIAWDDICANEAADLCGNCGDPAAGHCLEENGTIGCDNFWCCATVCAIDSFCCNVAWDNICAGEAFELCNFGDECTAPLIATDGSNVGTTADNSGAVDDTSCTAADVVDEWYSYVATCTGIATATTCNPVTDYDSALAVFSACGGTELACNDDWPELECVLFGSSLKSLVTWSTVEGTEYLIRVSGFGFAVGQYELNISGAGQSSYVSSPGLAMPDNNPAGVTDFLVVSDSFTIEDINVRVKVTHTYVGDLCCTLTHEDSGTSVILFQRMGDGLSDCNPGSRLFGCSADNMNVTLDSQSGAGSIENQCVANLMGSFRPEQSLAVFNGLNAASSWRLKISDNAGGDLGTLDEWELIISGLPCVAGCPQDCVTSATFAPPADGNVDAADLAFLLGAWGPNPGSCADTVTSATFAPPPDGVVDAADLAALLGAWGDPGCQP